MLTLSNIFLGLALVGVGQAQNCKTGPGVRGDITPSIRAGWNWSVVVNNIQSPRTIRFDSKGRLLVLASGVGVISMDLRDSGGACVSKSVQKTILADGSLNHGLTFSANGKTMYVSSSDTAWSYDYDSDKRTATNKKVLVKNMGNNDHRTRTLEISKFKPNMLIVSRGSDSNIDVAAASLSSGRSQIRAFDLNSVPEGGYDYATTGRRLGWGLRNSVGIGEHPATGGIYSVENSADQITRNGVDIHETNPAEEMNYHGTVTSGPGNNYGYPNCLTVFDPSTFPAGSSNLTTGTPFANMTSFDYLCKATTAPYLSFAAHQAPLDIKFNATGTVAYVTFHGSWNRAQRAGYKLSTVAFDRGRPRDPTNSTTAAKDLFGNKDLSRCPNNCFRPVSVALDAHGRVFVSSDATGEIYALAPVPGLEAFQLGAKTRRKRS